MDGKLQQRSDKDIEYQAVRREPPSDKAKWLRPRNSTTIRIIWNRILKERIKF